MQNKVVVLRKLIMFFGFICSGQEKMMLTHGEVGCVNELASLYGMKKVVFIMYGDFYDAFVVLIWTIKFLIYMYNVEWRQVSYPLLPKPNLTCC